MSTIRVVRVSSNVDFSNDLSSVPSAAREMTRVFERFSLAVSLLLLMRFGLDAAKNPPETDTAASEVGGDYVAPAIKLLRRINDSHVVEKSKEAAAIAIEHLGELAGKVAEELNEISKNHADDPNNLMPNMVKNYVWHPTVAVAKVGSKKLQNTVEHFGSELKEKYTEELKKIREQASDEDSLEQIAQKPIAAVKATSGVLKSRISGFFKKGIKFWRNRNKVEKTTEEHEK